MFVYLLSLPIWNFVLPTYAYWKFDDFSWGDTRKTAGEKTKKGGLEYEGEFDSSKITMRRWHDFEAGKSNNYSACLILQSLIEETQNEGSKPQAPGGRSNRRRLEGGRRTSMVMTRTMTIDIALWRRLGSKKRWLTAPELEIAFFCITLDHRSYCIAGVFDCIYWPVAAFLNLCR